ncbi:hypothetical protein ABM90_17180 [Rhodococcus erythropolis]|nr:hypothetical protein ABM90_17180 [Rhodococcus erythropolis]
MIRKRSQCPNRSQTQSVDRSLHSLRTGDAFGDIATDALRIAGKIVSLEGPSLIDVGVREGIPSIEPDGPISAQNRTAALA